jgi:Ca2+-binding EF-hand superfamily protein
MDRMGYIGLQDWYREKHILRPISLEEFVRVFVNESKLREIMLTIKEIDKDHNGYVTRTELDDILKIYYKAEFAARNILPFINKFGSISNKILIDYK